MENKEKNILMENKENKTAANWKMYAFYFGLVLGAAIGVTAFFFD